MQAATSIFNPFVFQCSSASRKFLNNIRVVLSLSVVDVSVLFSEPKIPQLPRYTLAPVTPPPKFQCSSASRKFLNSNNPEHQWPSTTVSVLFSEPKIPQLNCSCCHCTIVQCFSALQRAENSSIDRSHVVDEQLFEFQCSSATENSSIRTALNAPPARTRFQCSSASRKFLNSLQVVWYDPLLPFQCSSASRKFLNRDEKDG